MSRTYCYICGNTVQKKDPNVWYCNTCGQAFYENPKPCADLFLFDESGKILVARRKNEPSKGMLDIPGGFADFGETFEQIAQREILEELGLSPDDYNDLQYFASYFTEYPWGKETYQTLVAAFTARLKPSAQPTAQDDVAEVLFFWPDELIREDFGFPKQADLVKVAAKKLGLVKS